MRLHCEIRIENSERFKDGCHMRVEYVTRRCGSLFSGRSTSHINQRIYNSLLTIFKEFSVFAAERCFPKLGGSLASNKLFLVPSSQMMAFTNGITKRIWISDWNRGPHIKLKSSLRMALRCNFETIENKNKTVCLHLARRALHFRLR